MDTPDRTHDITVDSDGCLVVPTHHLGRPLSGQETIIAEQIEDGVALHVARRDARRAYIEVTTRCNVSCAMCMRQVWRDPGGDMSRATFASAMREMSAFGIAPQADHHAPGLQRVTFGGFGEPLAHPRILDMMTQAKALGLEVTLTTNGILLDHDMARALLDARVDTIIVSLDTMHVQAYQQAPAGGRQDYVLDNLSALSALVREQRRMLPRIGLAFVVTRSNLHELAHLPKLASTVGATFVQVSHLLPHTPEMVNEIAYDRDNPLPSLPGWPVRSGDYVLHGTARLPRSKWGAARRCPYVRDQTVVICWDGSVSPCYPLMHSYPYYVYGRRKNVTRYTLGTINRQSLADIWMSREYVRFRAKVRDFRFVSCVDCGMACSFAEDNDDCSAGSPSCADCLFAQDIIRCP